MFAFRGVVAGAVVVAIVPLAACSSDRDALTVYSGRSADLIQPLLEQFSDETGIAIDFRTGDSPELALLIDAEGGRTPADVFLSQSPGAVGFLDERGRLAELPESVLEQVDGDSRASDGSWVGLSGRVRVLVYNTELVDPADLPESVLDLTDPRYRGMVGVAPANASFQDFVTAMRAQLGDEPTLEWLRGMEANGARTDFANNVAIVEAVGRGEIPMGLVNHYYNVQVKEDDPDLPSENYFFPAGDLGSLLLVTAASVIEGTDRADEARQLVEFLLSAEAQEYFAHETFEYPLAAGVAPDDALPPFDEITVAHVELDDLGGGLQRTEELIDESGVA